MYNNWLLNVENTKIYQEQTVWSGYINNRWSEVAGGRETELPLNSARYVLMFMYETLHLCLRLCKCQTAENNCLELRCSRRIKVKHYITFSLKIYSIIKCFIILCLNWVY